MILNLTVEPRLKIGMVNYLTSCGKTRGGLSLSEIRFQLQRPVRKCNQSRQDRKSDKGSCSLAKMISHLLSRAVLVRRGKMTIIANGFMATFFKLRFDINDVNAVYLLQPDLSLACMQHCTPKYFLLSEVDFRRCYIKYIKSQECVVLFSLTVRPLIKF